LQPVAPTTTSQTYTTKDGSDYAKGIAGVAAIIFAIYLCWGIWLIILRCGRMDCCFRLCQYGDKAWRKRSRRRRSMNQSSGEGDVNSGVGGEQDEEDEDTGCCCYTCHERLAVKGGCCSRHIFCGWMAGKKVKLPTSSSIKRENDLREKSFITFDGIKSVSEKVGNKVGSGIVTSAKSMKKGSSTDVKESSENSQRDIPVAETTTKDEPPPNTADTEQPQDPLPPTASWVAEKQRINHDYLLKRQTSARRTILILRIVFLVASTLVLVCSSVLLAKGWQGVNSIVDSSQNTLDIVNDQVTWMMEGIEEYNLQNEQLKQDRLDFKAKTEESSDGTANGSVGSWCPASIGNGEIDVVIPLSQMLLRGNLIKLAFVEEIQEKASNIKDTTGDLVDKAQETVGGVKDTVGDVNLNVDSAAEVANNVVGGRKMVEVVGWGEAVADKAGVNTSEVVDNVQDTVGEVVQVVEDTVDVVKEKTMTVITFLDEIKDNPFIGKVLKVAKNKATDVVDDQLDENKRIAKIVATLRGLVKTLVKRISDEDAQRLLQNGLLKETQVTKDGIKYTVLDLVDDGTDSIGLDYGQEGIIFRGHNLTDLFNTNITISVNVANLSKTVNERLSNVSSRIMEIFTTLYTSLENVQYQTQSAQSSLDSILPYYYVAVSFIFVIMLLTLIFMIAVVLAWKDKQPRLFRHMNDAIVCPIFIISTLLMWIFTVVFLVLGLVGGDFCYETPDKQVTNMMAQVLTGASRIAYSKSICLPLVCICLNLESILITLYIYNMLNRFRILLCEWMSRYLFYHCIQCGVLILV